MQLSSTQRRLNDLALRRPVLFGIVLTVIWSATMLLLGAGLSRFSTQWFPDLLGSTLVNLGALLVPLAVVAGFGWWRQAGLALPHPGRSWWTLLPLIFFALSFAAGGLYGSSVQLLSSAVLFLVLGFNEELLYRGVIQHATNTLGAGRSVVWVAALFGFQHVAPAIFSGVPTYQIRAMMLSSAAFGIAYAAVRLRIGTIWPLAFSHGLEDFCNTRSLEGVPPWWHLFEAIFYVLYAAWLIRPYRTA